MPNTARHVIALAALCAMTPALAQSVRLQAEAGAATLLRVAAADYRAARKSEIAPSVDIAPATAGFARLCASEIAAVGAARAPTQAEADKCAQGKVSVVDIPLALDAVVVVVNPRNTWMKQVSLAQLQRAWSDRGAKARTWSDVDADWPADALKLYGPTAKVSVADKYASALGFANGEALRRDVTETEVLSLVADAVARDRNALGILDWAAYNASRERIRAVPVMIGAKAVQPSSATLADGTYGPFTYPMRLYVNAKAIAAPQFRDFLLYLLDNAERLAQAAALPPFAAAEYRQTIRRISSSR